MSKRDELIEKYRKELIDKFNLQPDMELLKKVVIGLGPSVYKPDAETVSSSDATEIERVKTNFLINKLGLKDEAKLDETLEDLMAAYGKSNRYKYRAVVYYLLTKKFNKESVY